MKNISIAINVQNSEKITADVPDFTSIITYGELKRVLPLTGNRKVPGINQLRRMSKVIFHMKTSSGIINIYANGFFTFEECGHTTVYGVDRCERPDTYSRHTSDKNLLDLSNYPWDMLLETAGSARLAHNFDSREEYQADISIDAPESENNLALSVRPDYEMREEEEELTKWYHNKIKKLEKSFKNLTEKQKKIIILERIEGLTQEQIAKRLGISRSTVREQLRAIKVKLNL